METMVANNIQLSLLLKKTKIGIFLLGKQFAAHKPTIGILEMT